MFNMHDFLMNQNIDPDLTKIFEKLASYTIYLENNLLALDKRISLIDESVQKMIKPLDELKKIMID